MSDSTPDDGKTVASTDAQFFDGGWAWMRHPSRNIGNAIPVFMFSADGVRWYVPLDPENETQFEWDERDAEWEFIVHDAIGPFLELRSALGLPESASFSAVLEEVKRLKANRWAIDEIEEACEFCAISAGHADMLAEALRDMRLREAAR